MKPPTRNKIRRLSARRVDALRPLLEAVHAEFNHPRYLGIDPLEFVHRYQDPYDQEVVALLSAVLAYGNVKQIRASVETVLRVLHDVSGGPAAYVRAQAAGKISAQDEARLHALYHRFNVGEDFSALFAALGLSWERHGFLGGHLARHLSSEAEDFGPALDAVMADWLEWLGPRATKSFRYFLTPPGAGSCCKRWCMLMRWMGRRDDLDPGLWLIDGPFLEQYRTAGIQNTLRPALLVIPLDTHTGKIAKLLKLTRRKSLDWKAAIEVTQALAQIDAEDPVRFDFALCRVGMLDLLERVGGNSRK